MIVSVSRLLRIAHVASCVAIIVLASVLVPLCVLVWDTFYFLDELVYNYVTLIPIVVGAISLALFVLSLVGIWAAAVGSASSFKIYTCSLTVVLLGRMLWSAVSSNLQLDFILALDTAIAWYMEHHQFQPSVMDKVQWRMRCCGKETPEDWFVLTGYIPSSCCYDSSDAHLYAECIVPEQLYLVPPIGCLRLIKDMPRQYFTIMQLMSHVCSVVLVLSLCVSYYMGKACSRHERGHYLIKKNIIEGKSAYEFEDNSIVTMLQRKLCPLTGGRKRLSQQLSVGIDS